MRLSQREAGAAQEEAQGGEGLRGVARAGVGSRGVRPSDSQGPRIAVQELDHMVGEGTFPRLLPTSEATEGTRPGFQKSLIRSF